MKYSHKTTHSFTPPIEFWRSIENLFLSFPFRKVGNIFKSRDELIKYYEMKTQEVFDIDDEGLDIYGNKFRKEFLKKWNRVILLSDIPKSKKKLISPGNIIVKTNHLGKIIKFLSTNVSNSETVFKFQHFIESMYQYLRDIYELDPDNDIIRSYGLSNNNAFNYEQKKERLFGSKYYGGLLKTEEFKDYFNSACRKYTVPFVMFIQKRECYVIHTTDIFVEKIIQNIPLFLNQWDLKQANNYFIKAYNERDKGNYPESLNNIRKGMEEIRNYIFSRYSIKPTISLGNDLRNLFDKYCKKVFDFSKIPESDNNKVDNIVSKLKESVSLAVKITNIGSHSSSVPSLIEENTSLFLLGLVASIFPYIFYLLKSD